MPETELKKMEDLEEIHSLVIKMAKGIRNLLLEETKTIDRKQAFLIMGRAINTHFRNFYQISLENADECLRSLEAPSEQGKTDGK
jgi:hypothetical protein